VSARLYLEQAVIKVERKCGNLWKLWSNRQHFDVPIQPGLHPELDNTPFLKDDDVQLYQSYIGVRRWVAELGRIDIAHVAGVMARFSAAPREGYMWIVLRIFAYCKTHNDGCV
jgi:hypothetical protein